MPNTKILKAIVTVKLPEMQDYHCKKYLPIFTVYTCGMAEFLRANFHLKIKGSFITWDMIFVSRPSKCSHIAYT